MPGFFWSGVARTSCWYQTLAAGGENIETGQFLAVWERRNGDRLMIQDIWSSDAPPAAQPAN